MKKKSAKKMLPTTTENLEARFNRSLGVLDYFVAETKQIVLDLPAWAIEALDKESARRGISSQDLIKIWLGDRLDLLEKKVS